MVVGCRPTICGAGLSFSRCYVCLYCTAYALCNSILVPRFTHQRGRFCGSCEQAGKIGVTERKMDEIFGSASPPEASRQLSSAIDNVVADMGRASQDASGEGGSNQHFMTAVEGFEPPTPSTTLLPTRSPKRRTAAPVIPDVVVEQADYTKPPTISPALRLTGRCSMCH